jgi:hypothetical protein
VGDERESGPSGLHRPVGQLGQKARRTGRYGGLRDEKLRKRERLTGALPRIPGRTDFGPRGRIEKGFQILIQGMRFKSKF